MHRKLKLRLIPAAAILVAAGLIQVGPGSAPARADNADGNCTSSSSSSGTAGGSADGTSVGIWLEVSASGTTGVCPGGAANTVQPTWDPPPCWWAPLYDPGGMQQFADQTVGESSANNPLWSAMQKYYVTAGGQTAEPPGYTAGSGPPYWQWNTGASADTAWWGLALNQTMVGTSAQSNCILNEALNTDGEPWSWADGAAPTDIPGPVITPEEMAYYAAEVMALPTTTFSSSPAYGTNLTVNLPTWLWMDAANYTQQTLTLCWEPTDSYCVTVVANPTSFKVNTDAPIGDYTLFDSGCVANGDTIGTEYQPSDGNADPPCGITFTHSTAGTPGGFGISVTVDWSITWAGAGAGFTVQDPVTSTVQDYQVQEIENLGGG